MISYKLITAIHTAADAIMSHVVGAFGPLVLVFFISVECRPTYKEDQKNSTLPVKIISEYHFFYGTGKNKILKSECPKITTL